MKDGPDIAGIANLIGDPGRANMLAALMSGKALTAGELASEAGVRLQTASGHLTRLEEGGLIARERQGRHHYFRLADHDVAAVLEALMGLAAAKGHLRTRTGPRDPELRRARVCYNHLAGDLGVALYDGLRGRGVLLGQGDDITLSDAGRVEMATLGIDLSQKSRSPASTGPRGAPIWRGVWGVESSITRLPKGGLRDRRARASCGSRVLVRARFARRSRFSGKVDAALISLTESPRMP